MSSTLQVFDGARWIPFESKEITLPAKAVTPMPDGSPGIKTRIVSWPDDFVGTPRECDYTAVLGPYTVPTDPPKS